MEIKIDPSELQPIVEAVVREVLEARQINESRLGNQIGFTESQAAQTLGWPQHTLRDLRLQGMIKATKIGRRVMYSRKTLMELLET